MAETYREALARAFSLLQEAGLNPQIAEWLCLALTGYSKATWLLSLDEPIPLEQAEQLTSWLERVLKGEPYQYVLGRQDFYGREFLVNPAVLIPRPETELLVEQVLDKVKKLWPSGLLTGVDVGTGSGVIAITLDLEMRPRRLEMLAVDISPQALEVARANAEKHQARVTFLESDLLAELIRRQCKVDLLVSNPPYIPVEERDNLERQVVDFEPHLALFAEEKGLAVYRRLIQEARHVLKTPGLLAFEVGMGQAAAVAQLIKQHFPQATCEIKKDFRGIERMVLGLMS